MKRYKDTNYVVHEGGRIQNGKTGQFLKPQLNGKGYFKVYLSIAGKRSPQYIHRLVAAAFVKRPRKKHCNQVNHIDGDKSNNAAKNLEWLTNSENQIHAHTEGLKPKAKLDKAKVRQIRRWAKAGKPRKEIAEGLKVSTATIAAVLNGKIYKYF